ncbi:MAG: LPS export ABC transporter periplasmic protein LptC, partial [Prolixibacteraceae bacterium]|nr:LPS export ABC transporter periplasmic protein LptC [Prolixibacteraceae bacterium]
KIVDSTNTLNSKTGTYFTRTNEVHFITNVRLMNDEYTLRTDTLIYNTETQIAVFEGPTNIVGDSTQIFSNSGWFNTQTNESELKRNSTIKRGETQLQANFIYYNDDTGEGHARDQIVINDYENQMIITGNTARYSDFNRYAMVTDSAVWIQYYEGDSLFLHADTLYTIPDSTADKAKMLITYPNVRFYRSDIQGICDSLIYYTKDSTIQLYRDPLMWSSENQLSADFIELLNNAEPPNEVYLKNNAFIIQQVDSSKFNQIKGKNMVGLIKGETLYRIDVNGNGQSIYFPADEEDYIGINKAESSNIILYLSENQINRITFVGATTGNLKPMIEIVPADSKLESFIWREEERPLNRFDIFGNNDIEELPETLPSGSIETILPDIDTAKEEILLHPSEDQQLDFESELPDKNQ